MSGERETKKHRRSKDDAFTTSPEFVSVSTRSMKLTRHLVAIMGDDHGEFCALGMSYQGFSTLFFRCGCFSLVIVNLKRNFNILVSKLNSFKMMNDCPTSTMNIEFRSQYLSCDADCAQSRSSSAHLWRAQRRNRQTRVRRHRLEHIRSSYTMMNWRV